MERTLDLKTDDVVYFLKYDSQHLPYVAFGVVDEIFHDVVYVDYVELPDTRTVTEKNIPIKEFVSEQRYRKLPKGWTYSTDLENIRWHDTSDNWLRTHSIEDPEAIKEGLALGELVKAKNNTRCHKIESEITKEGYRLVKKYDSSHRLYTILHWYEIYATYEEAKNAKEAYIEELKRQASLTDEEWSIEQIEKELSRWKKIYDVSDLDYNYVRDMLLAMDHIEDLEVRLFGGCIEWKYWKNKKWHTIDRGNYGKEGF